MIAEPTGDEYAGALSTLTDMAMGDSYNATTDRVRQLLLSLLLTNGSKVELGALLNGADRNNARAIFRVVQGWRKFGWKVEGLPNASDFVEAIQKKLEPH